MAGRCRVLLVEPPTAMSTAMVLSKAAAVMMSRGRRAAASSAMTARPEARARAARAAKVAGVRALPGRVMPRASARIFMVTAVPIMAQAPGPGLAVCSKASNFSTDIRPRATSPSASMRSV
jgi:hypothetical protein